MNGKIRTYRLSKTLINTQENRVKKITASDNSGNLSLSWK